MKKLISVILSILLVLGLFSFPVGAADVTALDVLTARNIASFYAAIWEFSDENGNSFSFGADFTLSHSEEIKNENGDVIALAFNIESTKETAKNGFVVISLDENIPFLSQIGTGKYINSDVLTLADLDGISPEEKAEIKSENELLLATLDEVDNMSFADRIEWFFDQIKFRLKYYLGDIFYGFSWDAESANRKVEETIREYAAENSSVVTNSYTVDKNYCVPQTQSYFFQSEEYYDGICGVAAWEMLLGFYRDSKGYVNLPDDHTMYKELMVIMDDITDKVLGGLDFLSDLNDIVTKYTDYYIPHDLRAHEIIGTLDAGIAIYLYNKGYEKAAQNVISNLSINVPLLTSAKRTLLLSDIQSALAEWIFNETDGKISYTLGIANSAEDTVVRSLKRGEPAVIGNWFSLDESKFTNHYFTAVGLYEIEGSVNLANGISFNFDRQFVEIYDTWTNMGSSFIDLENITLKAAYNANSIADLLK